MLVTAKHAQVEGLNAPLRGLAALTWMNEMDRRA